VTLCHSFTSDLAARTRQADVLLTACGEPRLVDGTILSPDTVVVDASATRVETDDGHEIVGDVDFESARIKADAITPVPGGVGPMTLASLLENVVTLAERRA
jgi:methylenetetrahydrofolate dehydrogenase (NADP+)/methenyltetrahydrofolate cyclohydrolase